MDINFSYLEVQVLKLAGVIILITLHSFLGDMNTEVVDTTAEMNTESARARERERASETSASNEIMLPFFSGKGARKWK